MCEIFRQLWIVLRLPTTLRGFFPLSGTASRQSALGAGKHSKPERLNLPHAQRGRTEIRGTFSRET